MKRFLIKILIFTLPVTVPTMVYLLTDPFKVLYPYKTYYRDGVNPVTLNKDFVSFETFKRYYSKYKYDSFIFGSSRSLSYHEKYWLKYIPDASIYHFDAWGETIYGIDRKAEYLRDKAIPIKNSLLILDHQLLSVSENSKEATFCKHPTLSGEYMLSFQLRYYKHFLNTDFVLAYCDYLINGKVKYMTRKQVLETVPYKYITARNELSYPAMEDSIAKYPNAYYSSSTRQSGFERNASDTTGDIVIKDKQIQMLHNVRTLYDINKTNYAVIVSPLYNRIKLHPKDLATLQNIFGKDRVFDFSGANGITNEMTNYYDGSHYRPIIAKLLIDSIYSTRPFQPNVITYKRASEDRFSK